MRFLIVLMNVLFLFSSIHSLEGGQKTNNARYEHERFIESLGRYYAKNKPIPHVIDRNRRKSYPRKSPIAIVGLGPAGLLAAIEAYKNGLAPIYAIDKRQVQEYSRDNIMRLDQRHFNVIRTLFANGDPDNPFETALRQGRIEEHRQGPGLEPLFREGETFYTIATKDLEVLLSGLLTQLQSRDPENLFIFRGLEFARASGSYIHFKGDDFKFYVHEVIDASGARGVVRNQSDIEANTQSGTGYYCVCSFFMPEGGIPEDMIPATLKTGAKIHQSYYPWYAESIAKRLKDIKYGAPRKNLYQEISLLNPIDRDKNQTPLLRSSYVTNKVRGQRRPGLEMVFIKRGLKHDYKRALSEFQWAPPGKFKRLPVTRFFTNKNLVYIGSEMSKAQFERVSQIKDRKEKKRLLERWAKFNLRQHLSEKIIRELKVKQYSAFATELKCGDKPVSYIDNIRVTTLGDSWVTPHFFAGSGLASAIDAVQEWSQFLQNPGQEEVFLSNMSRIKNATLGKPFNDLHKYEIMMPR